MNKQETIKFSELCNWNLKQKQAHEAVKLYKYILYGGAMGGGKSYWIRWELLYQLLKFAKQGFKNVVVGLFCEDYPALKDRQLSKISREFPDWLGDRHADHKDFGNCYILKPQYGGGVIAFRNLDDASKYKSAEFAIIAVDELTKNLKEVIEELRTRLRWPGIKDVKFLAGSNPGEIGHAWVKKWWMDKDFEEEMQDEKELFYYIQALAKDNDKLDPSYLKSLDSLPEDKRKAYRDGNWDIFKGQYFSEWRRDVHVIKPIKFPDHYKKFISGDYGFAKQSAILWNLVDEDGVVYVYRELYKTGLTYADLTKEIIAMTPENEKIDYWVFDPAIWSKKGETNLSGAEIMMQTYRDQTKTNLNLKQANNERISGWNVVREYLKPFIRNDKTIAKLQVFENCTELIRTLPGLVYDKYKIEDVDSDGEDHAPDSLRYGLTSRPKSSSKISPEEQKKLLSQFDAYKKSKKGYITGSAYLRR